MKKFILCLIFCMFFAGIAKAETEDDDGITAVFGSACETEKADEPKSALLIRTTDRASYDAVSKISHLSEIKNDLSDHDFNVMVYKVVDDMVEDVNIRTTKQDGADLCVEVGGYVKNENLVDVINSALKNEKDKKADVLREIEAEELIDEPAVEEAAAPLLSPPSTREDRKALVYIAPTEFFNNTKSSKHAETLKEQFGVSDYFYVTDDGDLADYTVRSKVLKAKIDAVNSTTSRLQMVISLEVSSRAKNLEISENQNRFVLFNNTDDEQEVAGNLMKKLMEKAGGQIMSRIEQAERKRGAKGTVMKIITPVPAGGERPAAMRDM